MIRSGLSCAALVGVLALFVVRTDVQAAPKKEPKKDGQVASSNPLTEFDRAAKQRNAAKQALMAKFRAPADEVKAAKKALAAVAEDDRRILAAMRFLAPQSSSDAPRFQADLNLPMLGTLQGNPDACADPWVCLRLWALARASFPDGSRFRFEIGQFLAGKKPAGRWCDVAPEVLAISALAQWTPDKDLAMKLTERGVAICETLNWEIGAPASFNPEALAELLNAALVRNIALAQGWMTGKSEGWKKTCEAVLAYVGKLPTNNRNLWGGAEHEKNPADRNRSGLMFGAFLNLARAEKDLGITEAEMNKALRRLDNRVAQTLDDPNAWRVSMGDALALALCAGGASVEVKEVGAQLGRRALGAQRIETACPRPEQSHIAAALGWVLLPDAADGGMGRAAVSVEDRDFASALCLGLAAVRGGLAAPAKQKPLPHMDKALDRMRALEVMEIEEHLDYMARTDDAIDRAARYLLGLQNGDGTFAPYSFEVPVGDAAMTGRGGAFLSGFNALCVLTLLDADVPRDNPGIRKAIAFLRKHLPRSPTSRRSEKGELDGWYTYSVALVLMAFQKYYEAEQIDAGIYAAKTPKDFAKAREKVWQAVPHADREFLGKMSWALSDTDGYGWGYIFGNPPQPVGSPVTDGPKGPITGRNAKKEAEEDSRDGRVPVEFPKRPDAPAADHAYGDASNSQYAVLGLKAALLLGAPIKTNGIAWECERLIDNYVVAGNVERVRAPGVLSSVSTDHSGKARPKRVITQSPGEKPGRRHAVLQAYDYGGWTYYAGRNMATWGVKEDRPARGVNADVDDDDAGFASRWHRSTAMTAAGISTLAIMRDALLVLGCEDKPFLERVELTMDGALFFMGRTYPYSNAALKLDPKISECWIGGGDGWGMCYDIYSVERACVLADVKYVASVDWYRDGADFLLPKQGADGMWPELAKPRKTGWGQSPGPETCNFCFCILFLKRAAPPLLREPARKQVFTGDKASGKKPPAAQPPAPEPAVVK
ncbi:MAG: terpene cyclase/mutase family protein [Planctomycetes bacterium]|nr:terpene cyclase/mutase family protein [Planctomycetota bacterium]